LTVAAPRLRQPVDLLACVGVGIVATAVHSWWRARAEVRDVDFEPYGAAEPADSDRPVAVGGPLRS
ncbi:MAG: hypothetical protein M3P95_12780, partial [Actinomycetota bacterium]|nr:hypothetical protein [Actinomycetota bacterium]